MLQNRAKVGDNQMHCAFTTRAAHRLMAATLAVSVMLPSQLQPASAEDLARNYTIQLGPQDANIARHLSVGVGKSIIVELPRDASEIFVGNPTIANAVVRSARRLYVIAATTGQTTIFAMDKDGQRIASLELIVGRDMDELRRILAAAIPDNDIHVATVNDTVILTGTVASAAEAQKAADIANAFVGYTAVGGNSSGGSGGSGSISIGGTQVVNGKLINSLTIRTKDQVTLRVTVAEVQRNVMKQLGVSPSFSNTTNSFAMWNNPALAAQTGNAGVGSLLAKTASGSFAATIQALEKNGVAHVLAEPNVTAISGESALFTAGGSVPVATGSTIDSTTGKCTISTTLQNYGVTLNFTPTVLSEGRISLHLATEVTDVDGTNSVQSGCSNQIGFRTRKNETTVELPSGGSIVSAGLIQQSSRQVIQGMPGLMNLPILGTLFRSRDYQREESELLIVVTPYIVKSLRPDQVSRPDDGFYDANDAQSMFLGRVNRIYSNNDNPQATQNFKGRVGFIHD